MERCVTATGKCPTWVDNALQKALAGNHTARPEAPWEVTHVWPEDGHTDLCLVPWRQTPWETSYDGQRLWSFAILQTKDWGTSRMEWWKKDLGATAPQTWPGSVQVFCEVNTDQGRRPWVTSILRWLLAFIKRNWVRFILKGKSLQDIWTWVISNCLVYSPVETSGQRQAQSGTASCDSGRADGGKYYERPSPWRKVLESSHETEFGMSGQSRWQGQNGSCAALPLGVQKTRES